MIEKAVFVSDLHLHNDAEVNARLFLKLLSVLERGDWTHLFLVGDVFDLWIADHAYFSSRFFEIIQKLKNLKAKGVEIHYFEGNHDLDLHPFFGSKIGCTVHETAYLTTIAGRRLRVEHGDEMDPEDRDYLFLRWFLRTPGMRWLGRHVPGRVVRMIGETASKGSRRYTNSVRAALDSSAVDGKILEHARKAYQQAPFDVLISGHVHRELDQVLKRTDHDVRVVNLGTWLQKPLVFELSQDRADLMPVVDFIEEK